MSTPREPPQSAFGILERGRAVLREVRKRAVEEIKSAMVPVSGKPSSVQTFSEPPVVARLVVEIRSDGSRTIARGALEDTLSDERVSVHAEGTTPLQLAASLASALVTLPSLASTLARNLRAAKVSAEPREAKQRQDPSSEEYRGSRDFPSSED